jgi:GR25 family glycosyltransferase involved in LPS biosynthesis
MVLQTISVGSHLSVSSQPTVKLNCYCITLQLESCIARQATFSDSAKRYDWDFIFWSGVDGLSRSFESCYINKPSPITGYWPTKAEMACAMSHLTLLKHFLEGVDDYRLICEDDVTFVSDPPLLVPSHDFDLLFLNSRCHHNRFHELWGASSCGTDTYLVTRSGAEKLVAILDENYLHLPIDMLILSQCVSMRKMGHHMTRFNNENWPDLFCFHDGPLTSHSSGHESLLSH